MATKLYVSCIFKTTNVLRFTSMLRPSGARRGILKIPGVEEDVGLVGIHWQGRFIELVPWNAEVSWEVDPWGRWKVSPLSTWLHITKHTQEEHVVVGIETTHLHLPTFIRQARKLLLQAK